MQLFLCHSYIDIQVIKFTQASFVCSQLVPTGRNAHVSFSSTVLFNHFSKSAQKCFANVIGSCWCCWALSWVLSAACSGDHREEPHPILAALIQRDPHYSEEREEKGCHVKPQILLKSFSNKFLSTVEKFALSWKCPPCLYYWKKICTIIHSKSDHLRGKIIVVIINTSVVMHDHVDSML